MGEKNSQTSDVSIIYKKKLKNLNLQQLEILNKWWYKQLWKAT